MDKNYCQKVWGNGGKTHLGGDHFGRRMDRQDEVLLMMQKVFGIREAKNGPKVVNFCCC